jgi:hypothetical protein
MKTAKFTADVKIIRFFITENSDKKPAQNL